MSMLLALIIAGMAVYWALRAMQPVSAKDPQAHCEQRVAQLIANTGGVGAEAQAAYDELPAECQRLLADPASRTPSSTTRPQAL